MASMKKAVAVADDKANEQRSRQLPSGHFLPEHSLPHAFSVVTSRISRMLEKMYSQQFGLSVVGWRIVAILGTHFPLSAKALGELTAMDQVSISRAVEQLAGKKLVSRRVDMADRRRVVLRLSKKGEEVYSQIVPVLYAGERALVSDFSKSDEAALRRIMKIMLERSARLLGEDCDWQVLLKQYGYGSVSKNGSDGE
jgi:DNA-binding MarR family transcriptional regulator